MKSVKLARDFKTAWPVTMEPVEYLGELNAHLEAIRQMLAFLKGCPRGRTPTGRQHPADKLAAAIDALPKVVYDPAHTAGLEAAAYKQMLARLRRRRKPQEFKIRGDSYVYSTNVPQNSAFKH